MSELRVLYEVFGEGPDGDLGLAWNPRLGRALLTVREDGYRPVASVTFRERGPVIGLRDALNELIDKWEDPNE